MADAAHQREKPPGYRAVYNPAHAGRVSELRRELSRLMNAVGLTDDRMPFDEGIKQSLPDLKIR